MKFIHIAIAGALLLSSGAAVAQNAADAGCVVVSDFFSKNAKDATQQDIAKLSIYFYLGRLSEHATAAQIKTLLDAQSKTVTDSTAGPMMTSCAKTVVTLVQSLSPPPPAAPATPPKKKPEGR